MEHFLKTTLELLAQFTGSQGGIEHGIVEFGLAGVFWLGLLILSSFRQQKRDRPHEKLLLLGFFLGFCRELFMIVMAALPAYGLYSTDLLHVIFPPVEHAIFDIALVIITAGYVQYLFQDKLLSYGCIKIGLFLVSLVYLSTAWWWGQFILANPESKFGQTWCDWLFRINASILLMLALVFFLRKTRGWKRNAISLALLFFFINQFLKMPDMLLGEVYERYFTPIRNGFYIFGIPIFGYVYIRELYEERKQSEVKLKNNQSFLNRIINQSPFAIWVSDKKGTMVKCNVALERLLNITDEQLIGKYNVFEDKVVIEQGLIPKIRTVFEEGKTASFSVEWDAEDLGYRDTKKVHIEGTMFPIHDDKGDLTNVVNHWVDISKRKQLEEEKKQFQAETMRAGHLASIGELAAGVAHEINNPVTGIISIAEIMADQFQELGGDRDIPERIINEGERIGNIVKNLLSFARDKKDEHSPAHIKDVLGLTLNLMEKQLFKDGIHLSVNITSDIPKITIRTQEIQQVFLNLISNARYALKKKYPDPHEKKTLEIIGKMIQIQEKEYVHLIFYDKGMGICAKLLDKITNPFFSTKPQGEGTGLGLSISHGIIKNHGGNLWFESVENEYTKIHIELPVNNGWTFKEEI